MVEINENINDSAKINVVTDDLTVERSSSTNDFLRFDGKSFLNFLLGLNLNWDSMLKKIYFGQKNINVSAIDMIHIKCYCIIGCN